MMTEDIFEGRVIKRWKAGVADTAWKVAVCANDAKMVETTLSWLGYVLDGSQSEADTIELLRKLSGQEIVKALLDYRERALTSIEAAIRKAGA